METDLIIALVLLAFFFSPAVVWLWVHIHWLRRGRDPKGDGPVIAQYETFEELPPALLGVVDSERVEANDIAGTLVHLAQRGFVQIESERKEQGIFRLEIEPGSGAYALSNVQYRVALRQPNYAVSPDLLGYEKLLLDAMFAKGIRQQHTFLFDLPSAMSAGQWEGIVQEVYEEAARQGLFRKNPEAVRERYYRLAKRVRAAGWVLCVVLVGVFVLLDAWILQLYAPRMPARTKRGKAAFVWAQGLKLYLHHAERFRLNRDDAAYHELLPYAIAFDMVKSWRRHFAPAR
jgi:hypothetical protein